MIRTRVVTLIVVLAGLFIIVAGRIATLRSELSDPNVTIAMAYDPDASDRAASSSREAYTEVMQEEGIPATWISTRDLLLQTETALHLRYRAIIFPDGLDGHLTSELTDRMAGYIRSGGTVAVVFDAGSRDKGLHFIENSAFAPLIGIDYGGNTLLSPLQRRPGPVMFRSLADAQAWSVPPGKLDGNKLVGYGYGQLLYPVRRGYAIPRDGTQIVATYGPDVVLSVRRLGAGNALWLNLPLGYLKAHGDDLPLRSFIRTIARRYARVPYVMPVPRGIGTVIINWHIDSEIETRGIPNLMRYGILRPSVPMEFDVTAGPDRDKPGDHLGIDACGKGRGLVHLLARYGAIGSHGGWAHNWFARKLASGGFTKDEIKDAVARNDRCLESVTKKPVTSYAAPVGLHPQPVMSQVLGELGFGSYYYTGDSGSPPTRTFVDGQMVSTSAWAFAIMPYHEFASIAEMRRGGVSPATMYDWLKKTADYLCDEHTATLIYAHPYDLLYTNYATAYGRFIDTVEQRIQAGTLQTMTMPDFTAFSKRFMKTRLTVEPAGNAWHAVVENPDGLDRIAVALPKWLTIRDLDSSKITLQPAASSDYTYFTITMSTKRVEIPLVETDEQVAKTDDRRGSANHGQ